LLNCHNFATKIFKRQTCQSILVLSSSGSLHKLYVLCIEWALLEFITMELRAQNKWIGSFSSVDWAQIQPLRKTVQQTKKWPYCSDKITTVTKQ